MVLIIEGNTKVGHSSQIMVVIQHLPDMFIFRSQYHYQSTMLLLYGQR